MTTLARDDALRRAATYPHAVLSFVDADGYPMSVAAAFTTDERAAAIEIGPVSAALRPADGQEVCITFSHIRPQAGVGYDERRYVNIWGPAARTAGGGVRVTVERATGWDEAEVPFFEYAERGVTTGRRYLADVGAQPRLSRWWTFFLATRLPFLTATIVPVALGGIVAARHHAFAWGWFLLTLLGACAVHLGLNIANDVFDDASGADAANVTPTPFSGGSRVIQYGLVSRQRMSAAAATCYVVAVAVGLTLAATRTWWLLAVGAIGLFLSLAYTAPPFRLVHRGLGEPVTALGFGPVMATGTYLALARTWSWEAFYVSLPVALLIALVLYVNQVPDRAGDAAAGKRTLIVRWRKDRVVAGYTVASALAFLLVVVGVAVRLLPAWTLLALLTAPMALKVRRALLASYEQPYALMPAMQTNIGLHLFTGLLLVSGYGLHLLTR